MPYIEHLGIMDMHLLLFVFSPFMLLPVFQYVSDQVLRIFDMQILSMPL